MDDGFPDISKLRLPEGAQRNATFSNPKGIRVLAQSPRVHGEFVKGPIPLDWVGKAAALPGKTLAVALAIMFESGRRRSTEIRLTTAICARFCVGRKAKYRGLKNLEEASLVEVVRQPRKNPLVKIIGVGHPAQAEGQNVPGQRPAGNQ
jgi:hypothetical protein